jgi:hypothetical protein
MYTAVVIVAFVLSADTTPTGYFQSARWGMSKDQVQRLYPDARRTKVEGVLRNDRKTSIGSVAVEFRYFFFGPKGLIGVSLSGSRKDSSDESLLSTFRSRYGPEEATLDLTEPSRGKMYSWQLPQANLDLSLYVSNDGRSGWKADYVQHGQHNAMLRLAEQIVDSERF